jgi:hypothetical protein
MKVKGDGDLNSEFLLYLGDEEASGVETLPWGRGGVETLVSGIPLSLSSPLAIV